MSTAHHTPNLVAVLRDLVTADENERALGTHGYSDKSPMAKRWNRARAALANIAGRPASNIPTVYCSSCGQSFGPGVEGFSHCPDHAHLRAAS